MARKRKSKSSKRDKRQRQADRMVRAVDHEALADAIQAKPNYPGQTMAFAESKEKPLVIGGKPMGDIFVTMTGRRVTTTPNNQSATQ